MKVSNVGLADRAIRMIVGFILLILSASGVLGVTGLFGLVLVVTSYSAVCPFYKAIEFSTSGQAYES